MMETAKIDLTGLRCPMPIVELNRMIREIGIGEEVIAFADDPAFCLDVESWCRKTGQELVSLEEVDGRLVAVIRRSA